ncbi:MAG: hypothetical protein JWP74_1767 [Marmoricola sp.]|nr:hypothetical protein [Marmoricola sp.]
MERAATEHRWSALHEDKPWHNGDFTAWAEKRSDATPYHFKDGVTLYVSDRDDNPDDDFLTPVA